MRLLQSILPYFKQTKKPQCRFIMHLLGLLLAPRPRHVSESEPLQCLSRADLGSLVRQRL